MRSSADMPRSKVLWRRVNVTGGSESAERPLTGSGSLLKRNQSTNQRIDSTPERIAAANSRADTSASSSLKSLYGQ